MEYDFYILKMVDCIDPVLIGPFDSQSESDSELASFDKPSESGNVFTAFKISKGAKVIF
jgi:hypothetical protein